MSGVLMGGGCQTAEMALGSAEPVHREKALHSAEQVDGEKALHSAEPVHREKALHSAEQVDGEKAIHSAEQVDGEKAILIAEPVQAEKAAARGRIPVLEIFGPTVQGEGMVIGVKTMFVRTAGCDYSCSWCDSAFTWDGSGKDDIRMMNPDEIVAELGRLAGDGFPGHVTLSGGNPALLRPLGGLIDLLHAGGALVALETQGSRWQDWFVDIDELTLSPKPPSSGMETDWEALADIVARLELAGRTPSLKVVVMDERDLGYAKEVHRRFPAIPMFLQSGNDRLEEADAAVLRNYLADRYERLVDQVMADPDWKRVRVLPQLHAWLWGNKRGV